ncbi:MAG: cell division protein ZapA [Gammaproteobacteria bacterium]|nr:cell division protein ZapA [Gammaproteobacteria bacterium]
MSNATASVTVKILDKEYQVACPEEEKAALLESANHLNERMKEIRDSGKVVGLDRMAVMVALNLANELLQTRKAYDQVDTEVVSAARSLRERMDAILGQDRQFEF